MTTLATLAIMAAATASTDAPAKVTAEMAMETLRSGNQRYVAGQMHLDGHDAARRTLVAAGQHPHTIVVTCADSRVSPEIVFDQGMGDLFVVRVAGNVLDTNTVASIEYAAEHLESPLLVVMGHERCGAVAAALDVFKERVNGKAHGSEGGADSGHGDHANIYALLGQIMPSVRQVAGEPGDFLANAISQNVRNTMADCYKRSPMLTKMAASGSFRVTGAVYDLDSGKVEFLAGDKPQGESFVKIHH